MALDRATLRAIASVYSEALQLGSEAARLVDDQLDQLAALLPRPDAWTTLGRGDGATVALLAGDVLLTLSRETAGEEQRQLVVTAHRLEVTEVAYRRADQHTRWDFRFRDREPLRVEGRMSYTGAADAAETVDQAEAFARALASSIGWRIVEQASAGDHGPHRDALTDPDSAARSGSSRRQVTDLWGNPISKPKRRKPLRP